MTNQASPAIMALGAQAPEQSLPLSLAWQLAREPFPSINPRDTWVPRVRQWLGLLVCSWKKTRFTQSYNVPRVQLFSWGMTFSPFGKRLLSSWKRSVRITSSGVRWGIGSPAEAEGFAVRIPQELLSGALWELPQHLRKSMQSPRVPKWAGQSFIAARPW